MNVFELFGTIAIDHSGAERSLDKTVKHAKDAENALTKTFKRIGTAVAAAFSVGAVVNFGKACTEVFASVAAEESAFAQIMGDYADTAQAKLNAVADSTGVVSTRLTSSMTSLTAKFKGLGYGVEDATTLAADGLLIATDAAAFWDMSLDESMSHLNSFINGSYEGGEAIGLFANDTQMAAYAIEKGIVADTKAWAALDEATKQATRLDYAKNMQAQSGATGQAAKESQSYANVMANLKERWRQFQAIIGKPILEKLVLPAMQKLNDFMPKLNESVQNGIVWLTEGFDKVASYFTDVFTEDGLKLDALPNAFGNMFRDVTRKIPALLSNIGRTIRNAWANNVWPAVQGAFKATLGIDLPEWSEIEFDVSEWWKVIRKDIENALDIDLSNIDIAGIFTAAETAVGNLLESLKTFYTDISDAIATDETGRVNLNKALSGLFDAGVDAMANLLTTASTLVTDIVGSITGNKEDTEKISSVFSDLFGWAGEIVTGVKDDALAVFDWFLANGRIVAPIISTVAWSMAKFVLANPAIAAIEALMLLIAALSTDWTTFEANYPHLVEAFESLTGLDFTNVANSLEGFKNELEGIAAFFKENEEFVNLLLVLLGATVMKVNPVAGLGMIAAGGISIAENPVGTAKGVGDTVGEMLGEGINLVTNNDTVDVEKFGDAFATTAEETAKTIGGIITGESYSAEKPLIGILLDGLKRSFNFKKQYELSDFSGIQDYFEAEWDAYRKYQQTGSASDYDEQRAALAALVEQLNLFTGDISAVESVLSLYAGKRSDLALDTNDLPNSWFNGWNLFQNKVEELEQERHHNRRINDESGGGGYADTIFKTDDGSNNQSGMSSLLTVLQTNAAQMKSEIVAAVQEGMSGITITANVDTGNVMLDTGTMVGTIAPRINFRLGALNARSSRG